MKQDDIQPIPDQPDKLARVIHQKNENCQVFNGPMTGCVFAMPGANTSVYPDGVKSEVPAKVEPKPQEPLKPTTTESKASVPEVDVEALWKAIETRVDRLDPKMNFMDDYRKEWSVVTIKKVIAAAINKDNLPLKEDLKQMSLLLRYWFVKRLRVSVDRCFDLTLMNVIGYLVGKELMPNRETQIIGSMYPEATKTEVDAHKSAIKNGHDADSAFCKKFAAIMDNAIDRWA